MTDDLQQKINFLCEKLSIGGWKPEWCNGPRGWPAIETYCPHGSAFAHDIPAPDLLSPEGHLMLEKALQSREPNYIITYSPRFVELWRHGARDMGYAIIVDDDLPRALVEAAYDALMEGASKSLSRL